MERLTFYSDKPPTPPKSMLYWVTTQILMWFHLNYVNIDLGGGAGEGNELNVQILRIL